MSTRVDNHCPHHNRFDGLPKSWREAIENKLVRDHRDGNDGIFSKIFGGAFDAIEDLIADRVSTSDKGRKSLDSMDLTNIDDVRDLMRRAAEGDEDAKELLKENSDLVQLTVQDFAAGQQLMSNLSQAFFSVDKSIIGNIRA